MTRIAWAYTFTNQAGEQHTVVVELLPEEVADVEREARRHRCDGFAPLERRFAFDHAVRSAPPGFDQLVSEARVPSTQLH